MRPISGVGEQPPTPGRANSTVSLPILIIPKRKELHIMSPKSKSPLEPPQFPPEFVDLLIDYGLHDVVHGGNPAIVFGGIDAGDEEDKDV